MAARVMGWLSSWHVYVGLAGVGCEVRLQTAAGYGRRVCCGTTGGEHRMPGLAGTEGGIAIPWILPTV